MHDGRPNIRGVPGKTLIARPLSNTLGGIASFKLSDNRIGPFRERFTGLALLKRGTDLITNLVQRQLLGLVVLTNPRDNGDVVTHINQLGIVAGLQDVLGEQLSNQAGMIKWSLATVTGDARGLSHFQTQFFRRAGQVIGCIGRVGKFGTDFRKTFPGLFASQFTTELLFHFSQRRHLGLSNIFQTDQMDTEGRTNRLGNLPFLKGKQRLLKGLGVNTAASVTQIAAVLRRDGVNRILPGQIGKGFTGRQALLDRRHGFVCFTAVFDQDVRRTTLLARQISRPPLVIGLKLRIVNFDALSEGTLGQGNISGIDPLRLLERP